MSQPENRSVKMTGARATTTPTPSATKVLVQVTFSTDVTVTGSPRLELNVGGGDGKPASYSSVNGASRLLFSYTVAPSLSGCPGALRRRAVAPRSGCRPARLRCATTRIGSGQPAGNRAPLVAPAHPAAVAPPEGYGSEARRSGRAFGVYQCRPGRPKWKFRLERTHRRFARRARASTIQNPDISTTHAWRFRRLRARVSLVIPW